MPAHPLTALRLFTAASPHLDVWALAGPRHAATRAAIMSNLVGERVPQARAGITALRAALEAAAGVTTDGPDDCLARREDRFRAAVRAQLDGK